MEEKSREWKGKSLGRKRVELKEVCYLWTWLTFFPRNIINLTFTNDPSKIFNYKLGQLKEKVRRRKLGGKISIMNKLKIIFLNLTSFWTLSRSVNWFVNCNVNPVKVFTNPGIDSRQVRFSTLDSIGYNTSQDPGLSLSHHEWTTWITFTRILSSFSISGTKSSWWNVFSVPGLQVHVPTVLVGHDGQVNYLKDGRKKSRSCEK